MAQYEVKSGNYLAHTYIMREAYVISKPESNVPKTYKQVLQSPAQDRWIEATREE